jgi:4-aminobutyrate aminotransferase-like enzyme/Ser/Thr protein kinase RdoA (MazF antagonist)
MPRPEVTIEEAERIAADHFDLRGEIVELGSQQDRNFRIATDSGTFVLKLANPAFTTDELRAQSAALALLGSSRGFRVPSLVSLQDGEDLVRVEAGGRPLLARVLTYLEGEPLTGVEHPSAEQLRTLGALSGGIAAGLASLEHPGLDRQTQWDAQIGGEVVDLLIEHVESPAQRRIVREAADDALARLAPLRPDLRRQAIHGDVTDDNIVLADESGMAGVIDFGDVAIGWLVAELAATVTSALHHIADDPLAVLDVIAAFDAESPLTDPEISALWPLVVLRGAVLVVSGEQQVSLDTDNAYAEGNRAHEWIAFDIARNLDPAEMEAVIRWRLRGPDAGSTTPPTPGRLLALEIGPRNLVDLSVTSHGLDAGAWLFADAEQNILARTTVEFGTAITRYAEHRMTRAVVDRDRPSATMALAVTVTTPTDTSLFAPFGGILKKFGDSWRLRATSAELDLWLDGLTRADDITAAVSEGDRLGSASVVTVQLSRIRDFRPPQFVSPSIGADIWAQISPDPSALFGLELAAPDADASLALDRRDASFARVQEHYYEHPPLIERGWKHHLVDTHGQTYIDMVNNVTAVGHAHPRLVSAVRDQWALLNTNSRFHYEELARFTSRLAALAPDPLDTVFLVNSGSEAVDLALRLAQTHTGRRTILALKEAYHGWTVGADAVSSSIGDNPRALETRPDWVRLVESPHTYRGKYRGDDSAGEYLSDLDASLASLDDDGVAVAGFIAEPVFGNAGGVMLPSGYLEGVYSRIRARGGVCIADEVQVGYGRLGQYFWGFSQQGVVPDIITVAKAMGNGHPLGAVITTREIADSFAAEGSFFSSAGGSPVSARVGLTVLDIMRDENLQANALEVGTPLQSRLLSLASRYPLIGAVHGMGLYLGVELVLSPTSLEPATAEAALICERLLAAGVIVQPTGDHKNVLKIKPPLCLTVASADRFVDALELVLATL